MSDSRSLIQDALHPGERLLWSAQPQPWRLALPMLLPLAFIVVWAAIPFSVFLTMFAADGSPPKGADAPPPEAFFILFPGIFVLVGSVILLAILRSVVAAWRTHYGLTDQRGVILVDLWPRSVQSYGPAAFAEMSRTGGDDRGTIRFGQQGYGRRGRSWGYRAAFAGIADPRRVETMIYQTLLKNRPAESARS